MEISNGAVVTGNLGQPSSNASPKKSKFGKAVFAAVKKKKEEEEKQKAEEAKKAEEEKLLFDG